MSLSSKEKKERFSKENLLFYVLDIERTGAKRIHGIPWIWNPCLATLSDSGLNPSLDPFRMSISSERSRIDSIPGHKRDSESLRVMDNPTWIQGINPHPIAPAIVNELLKAIFYFTL